MLIFIQILCSSEFVSLIFISLIYLLVQKINQSLFLLFAIILQVNSMDISLPKIAYENFLIFEILSFFFLFFFFTRISEFPDRFVIDLQIFQMRLETLSHRNF